MIGDRLLLAALLYACSPRAPLPDSSASHLALGLQWLARAHLEAEAGRDPGAFSLRSLSELDEARILDKSDPRVLEEMARAHVFLADHLLRRGGDPRSELLQARTMLAVESTLAASGATELALAALERALEVEWVLAREENPAAALAQGFDLALVALDADPRAADAQRPRRRGHSSVERLSSRLFRPSRKRLST